MSSFHKLSKRPFLLLEVLICLALVALTAFPLLTPPMMILRNERVFTRELELARLASEEFSQVVIDLYSNAIPFELVLEGGTLPTKSAKGTILFGKPDVKYEEVEEVKEPRYLLSPVTIELEGRSYKYSVFIEKKVRQVLQDAKS